MPLGLRDQLELRALGLLELRAASGQLARLVLREMQALLAQREQPDR